ncbi:hypothetical protein BDR03DRAFT_949503, partial [Suillus americanus]
STSLFHKPFLTCVGTLVLARSLALSFRVTPVVRRYPRCDRRFKQTLHKYDTTGPQLGAVFVKANDHTGSIPNVRCGDRSISQVVLDNQGHVATERIRKLGEGGVLVLHQLQHSGSLYTSYLYLRLNWVALYPTRETTHQYEHKRVCTKSCA